MLAPMNEFTYALIAILIYIPEPSSPVLTGECSQNLDHKVCFPQGSPVM